MQKGPGNIEEEMKFWLPTGGLLLRGNLRFVLRRAVVFPLSEAWPCVDAFVHLGGLSARARPPAFRGRDCSVSEGQVSCPSTNPLLATVVLCL